MAVGTLRPNSTDQNTWTVGDHTDVDEEVTQPDAGDENKWGGNQDDNNEIIKMGFPNTINDVDEVTNITIWCNGFTVSTQKPEIWIDAGGVSGEQQCNLPVLADDWTSNSFDGSWTQLNLDALQVCIRMDATEKVDGNTFDVIYVVVTYSQVAVGYGHDFMGVPAANIDEVNGIPAANIDTIKGV